MNWPGFVVIIILVMVCGIVIAMSPGSEGTPIKMTAGTYEALSVAKGFDTETAEPVYYIVAMRIDSDFITNPDTQAKIPVGVQQPIKLYKVGRQFVKNLVFDKEKDTNFHFHGKLEVGS